MKPGCIVRGDGSIVIPAAWLADRWWTRLRGLLLRKPLDAVAPEALLIKPCASVHTFGMAYPLDLVFLNREGQVCGWKQGIKPWRVAACRQAEATLELHAGTLERLQPRLGEPWRWQQAT